MHQMMIHHGDSAFGIPADQRRDDVAMLLMTAFGGMGPAINARE